LSATVIGEDDRVNQLKLQRQRHLLPQTSQINVLRSIGRSRLIDALPLAHEPNAAKLAWRDSEVARAQMASISNRFARAQTGAFKRIE
jgi:hypothetical protein